jgi:integrase/recombinase XerD
MRLSEAVARYVAHRKAMGMRFCTEKKVLKSFCRNHGETELEHIKPEQVRKFILGDGPATLFSHRKRDTLLGFYRFSTARGYTTHVPLPSTLPKPSANFVPYIFSQAELKRLLDTVDTCQGSRRLLQGFTFRTLLLLLYGAGLRLNEALSLTLADVDLTGAILHVRNTKFYKTRLVPIGADLCAVLAQHVTHRHANHPPSDTPLLVTSTGTAVPPYLVEDAFRRLRRLANVLRNDGARYQPRLHDLRHAAAVHRLINWYRSGADVQRLLPHLATYLGHIDIAATQRYLTLVPELLQEASRRFECYARGEHHE